MKVIGVTGGIGAGKSAVLSYLKDKYGAQVEPLDEMAKEMLLPGGRNYQAYIDLLGQEIVLPDGTLDRAGIAERIFSDETLLERINALVNPAVKEELSRRMTQAGETGVSLFVIESAVLLAENYDELCDETWYIYADDAVRAARLQASRGYSRTRIQETMKRQMGDESFRRRCTCWIDNSGGFEETKRQIDARLGSAAHQK